ncbi:hypothetical protein MKW94_025864 [Papaver nudicaule]|uniref:TF-B3 domain-containing protein n=1 Tax=Papaver nudicaule TaxID=74823 RepID=A0AA41S6C6_PAPNU|nr:hypothetical protein [Papaver nudicaule]
MADDNSSTCNRQLFTSSTFSSLSPSSQHKNVILVHDHELQQQQQQKIHKLLSSNSVSGFSKSRAGEVADHHEFIQKEYMFDKLVTPSDVGRLRRLVIPKLHAERYFPSTANNEKGLLLSFEDRNGKPWTFMYCYWNSSQSYVMTKGWSRFVKEKRLGVGDTVYFGRGASESCKDRYYIDWKHRTYSRGDLSLYYHHLQLNCGRKQHHYYQQQQLQQTLLLPSSSRRYGNFSNIVSNNQAGSGPVVYVRSTISSPAITHACVQAWDHQQHQQTGLMLQNYPGRHDRSDHMEVILNSVPVVHGKAASTKRIRLFGVNLECLVSEDACDINLTLHLRIRCEDREVVLTITIILCGAR